MRSSHSSVWRSGFGPFFKRLRSIKDAELSARAMYEIIFCRSIGFAGQETMTTRPQHGGALSAALERKFGAQYLEYKASVRRWL